jgi:hypothetical protein
MVNLFVLVGCYTNLTQVEFGISNIVRNTDLTVEVTRPSRQRSAETFLCGYPTAPRRAASVTHARQHRMSARSSWMRNGLVQSGDTWCRQTVDKIDQRMPQELRKESRGPSSHCVEIGGASSINPLVAEAGGMIL